MSAPARPQGGAGCVRARARIEGTVQGVGFRPFVYRLARELALAGWVRNDERGVELEVEGAQDAVDELLERVASDAPPLAVVERVRAERREPRGASGFAIVSSERSGLPDATVTADAASCPECLAELFDPADRRFRYPFVNCTNCGPRFTIVRGVPYDRSLTTMAGFTMCPRCAAEYEDPGDRRFHAQPNACPACGPRASLCGAGVEVGDPVRAAATLLAEGAILAVKGLGGYHLACRADEQKIVSALRSRKRREDRPFALMARDLAGARRLACIQEQEAGLLSAPARPIVLAPRRPDAPVAPAVAPRVAELGIILPYAPLHHLLMADLAKHDVAAVVMTSGNVSDEPIAYEDDEARARLAGIADAFLTHDRPIHMRTDDSVVRAVRVGDSRVRLSLRRSRGLVPSSLRMPVSAPEMLACGAELKSTFCLARGERAWMSHHIGDLRNWETLSSFREGVAHFEDLFAVTPRVVAHDLHPDYLSTAYALERDDVDLVGVQHHHAHLAAVLAEHGESGPAVGAVYDGAGHGSDGTSWGGELLVGDLSSFTRAAHLLPVPLPGADRAVRQPWRMACVWLQAAVGTASPSLPAALADHVEPARWEAVSRLAAEGTASPVTTSIGRLCDAVAALCGVHAEVSYEGQAAIELEAIADRNERGAYEVLFAAGRIDPRPAIRELAAELAAGVTPATVSARFHNGLGAATADACAAIAADEGIELVVLSGGVFQNRLLLEGVARGLQRAGLRVLVPERLPPNDGAIAFGQAAIAAVRDAVAAPGSGARTAATGAVAASAP